ncbi:MAG: type III toxin-antitoxin system ToxN/AbiQ family toxin [Oscillospiraceae bacterium]|nr:type III toxin-antitoxin system ToxN/AbiQ family toxin [Oscillospiraceae bacterium]
MKNELKLYSVSDRYIQFLRSDKRLDKVFSNKEDKRKHTRKYLGVVIQKGGFDYFIPLSSKRYSDYFIDENGNTQIRKTIVPIIRMVITDTYSGEPELKGTLKISNMIPVPQGELTQYDILSEKDVAYKDLVEKEYAFIKANSALIQKYADILYNQKTKENVLYAGREKPNYLESTIDFLYAETICEQFYAAKEAGKPS